MPLNTGAQAWQTWPSALFLCPDPSTRKWEYQKVSPHQDLWQAPVKFKYLSTEANSGKWEYLASKKTLLNMNMNIQPCWIMSDWSQKKHQENKH